ncbi:hypothetical protein [Azospirillum griseum]|uniref:Tetratricopeptide repeat protein n=1 Tax=Azospirillum griseum TaxID=2496639 RepID=A0A3S0JI20_9PROT|nr:hypothetical protein [Azospirillum griseum]RTR19809.1 hypothetical protein EJ903_12465 [Azospirillum griseum]
MSSIDPIPPRPDHPWWADFEADPAAAFDGVIRSVAVPFPYSRGEPREALALLFGALSEQDALRAQLDQTLGDWIERRRHDEPDRRLSYGLERYIQELSDALHLIHRLDLRNSAERLRRGYFLYRGWFGALRLNDARDALGAFWTVLAHSQTDARFLSRWYALCEEAARARNPVDLSIGLLGLRQLPADGDPKPLDAALSGLARWGALLGEQDHARFRRQWRALRALYPRGPQAWVDHVLPLLKGRNEPFADWWRAELPKTKGGGARGGFAVNPPLARVQSLAERIGYEPIERVRPDIERLIDDQLHYAEATGVSHYVVRTACNIGTRVLADAPDLAYRLARIAVRWEPHNPFGWNLWSASLIGLGRDDLAELLMWDITRRFPDDAASRPALAELLGRTGRDAEAEALYRATMDRFPDNDVSRTAFITLLIRRSRLAEAERWLPDLRRLNTESANNLTAALNRAKRGEPPFAGHGSTTRASVGNARDLDAEAVRGDGRAARAAFRLSMAADGAAGGDPWREAAEAELADLLRDRPDHAAARLIQVRHAQAGAADRAARWAALACAYPNDYGLRLDAARATADAAALAGLMEDFPRRAPVTRLARLQAGLGDAADAHQLTDWLADKVQDGDPVLSSLWTSLTTRIGPSPDPQRLTALAQNDPSGWLAIRLSDAAFAATGDALPLVA